MSSRDALPPAPLNQGWGDDSNRHGAITPASVLSHESHTPPALANRLDLGALLKGLRRHWVLALTLGAICSAAAAGLVYNLLPASEYTATSLVEVAASERGILKDDTRFSSNDYRTFQKTQETLVKSPLVLGTAAADERISRLRTIREHRDDPASWLAENVRISFQGEVMSVSLGGGENNKQDLAPIVDTVVETYMNRVVNRLKFERKDEYDILEKLKIAKQDALAKLRKTRAAQTTSAGASSQELIVEQNRSVQLDIEAAKKEFFFADNELKKAQIELELARRDMAGAAGGLNPAAVNQTIEDTVNNHPAVVAIRNRVNSLQNDLDAAMKRSRNPESDQLVRQRKRQHLEAQAELEQVTQQVRAKAAESVQSLAASQGQGGEDINEIRRRIEFYTNYCDYQTNRINELQAQLQRVAQQSNDLSDTDTQILTLESHVKKMEDRLNHLEAELGAPARIRVLQTAQTPKTADTKKRLIATTGAGLGTFGLVLLGISFLEFRVRRIDSPDAVAQGLGMRIIGALPATPSRSRFALPGRQGTALQEAYWRSRLNESVNAIRTLMLRHSQNERLQVVMVTSASVGEGKTSLACHLATSLARAGRRTLLLDCDLRNPTAHRVFDLPLEPGMSEVLRGQVSLEEVSHPIALGELRMITAGRCDLQALHALGMEQAGDVINRLRSQYDFIVIDTPPVLPVADPLLIGQHVDAALFSILRDVSRAPKVHTACERLSALGVRILGAVVAGTPLETSGSEYYYTAAYVNAGTTNTNNTNNNDDLENASS